MERLIKKLFRAWDVSAAKEERKLKRAERETWTAVGKVAAVGSDENPIIVCKNNRMR